MMSSATLKLLAAVAVSATLAACASTPAPAPVAVAPAAAPAAAAPAPAPEVIAGDAALVLKIRAAFAADDLLKGETDAKVTSTGTGQITLNGTVTSVAAFRRAIDVARAGGAVELNNKLQVAPAAK